MGCGGSTAADADAQSVQIDVADQMQRLQGNVVDLSAWDLSEEGSADSQLVVAWMTSGPGGLTRLVLDAPKACAAVVAALHTLVAQTKSLVDLDVMDGPSLPVLHLNGVESVGSIELGMDGTLQHGPVSAAVIAACIRENPTLVTLTLNVDGHPLPLDQLRGTTPTESIDLSGKFLCSDSAVIIAGCVGGNEHLKQLNLAKNYLAVEGTAALAKVLPETKIESLNLKSNEMGAKGTAALADVLPQTQIKDLNLCDNNITKHFFFDTREDMSAVIKLAEVLPQTSITSLDLSNNALCGLERDCAGTAIGTFTLEGLTPLCEAFTKMPRLTSVSLKMGPEGTAALANVLSQTQIQTLDVDDGPYDHPLPLDQLRGTTPTESIDFSGKTLGAASAIIIAACIGGNVHLKHLTLFNMGPEAAAALAKGPLGPKLQSLNFIESAVENATKDKLCSENPSVEFEF